MITVACVQVGIKYPFDHVVKLKNMVARHLPIDHRFVCLTDNPQDHEGIECVDVSGFGLPGWWSKMCVFNREIMPEGRILYFDLDTVIIGDLTPLAKWDGGLGICENFTRLAGHKSWPCKYGSCVMVIPEGFGQEIWHQFVAEQSRFIQECHRGDQEAIEAIHPFAGFLQQSVPDGFFLGYRDLTNKPPPEARVVVFGGSSKPKNCKIPWIREAWK